MKITRILSIFALSLALAACNAKLEPSDPNPTPHDAPTGKGAFTKDGNLLGSFKGFGGSSDASSKLGVNAYLWRSSLESVSFMPLTQADSAGGVIITDWMNQPGDANQQVKVNVFILTQKLDPNGLTVKVFNRIKADGQWQEPILDKQTSTALEETILSKARVLKVKAQAQ